MRILTLNLRQRAKVGARCSRHFESALKRNPIANRDDAISSTPAALAQPPEMITSGLPVIRSECKHRQFKPRLSSVSTRWD